MTVLIFGVGPLGLAIARQFKDRGHAIIATGRSASKRHFLNQLGYRSLDPIDIKDNPNLFIGLKAVIITAPPSSNGCPAFELMHKALSQVQNVSPLWICYASSTSVYGDAKGRWVDEGSKPIPISPEGENRLGAETQWLSLRDYHYVQVFRLPGLYGIERNAFLRINEGKARLINDPQQVFSRLHHDDGALGFWAGFQTPKGGVYNLCDDWPSSPNDPLNFAAKLMDKTLPKDQESQPRNTKAARFYNENKRVSNARAKSVLDWRPQYPSYSEGLSALYSHLFP
jgi:nucleoside-diphosphate-sugar epimerase